MTKDLIGTATKSRRLLGGQEWSDLENNCTIHAAASESRTACGVRIGTEAKGWFLETRHVPSDRSHVTCARCAALLPPAAPDDDDRLYY